MPASRFSGDMLVSRRIVVVLLSVVAVFAVYNVYRFVEDDTPGTTQRSRSKGVSQAKAAMIGVAPTQMRRKFVTGDDASTSALDGAFYRAADIATRDEDWAVKECALRKLSDLKDLFHYIKTPTLRCDTQLMLGGHFRGKSPYLDGDKWLCVDERYRVTPRQCLVYSFGIAGDWSFEDDVEHKLGCKVHAFDPTINKKSYNRTAMISFYDLGIGAFTNTGPKAKMKVDRYENILAGLGHLGSVIDVLKIDVEGHELEFFKDVFENTPNLLKNVKMIAMELHLKGDVIKLGPHHREFWKYFQLLECFGFKIWHTARNPFVGGKVVDGEHRAPCYEVVWVQDRDW